MGDGSQCSSPASRSGSRGRSPRTGSEAKSWQPRLVSPTMFGSRAAMPRLSYLAHLATGQPLHLPSAGTVCFAARRAVLFEMKSWSKPNSRNPPPRTPWTTRRFRTSRQISFGFLLEADQEVTPSMPRWQPGSRKTEPASTSLFGEVIAGIVPGATEKSTAIAPACQARGTSSIMSAAIPPPTP